MKIIHTSDLHLKSPLTSRLSPEKAVMRARELEESFARLCEAAMKLSCDAVIIAGDLFDTAMVGVKALDTIFTVIRRYPCIKYLYLPGNHEGDVIARTGLPLPENLFLFGKEWTYFDFGDLRIAGRCENKRNMMSTLDASGKKNIAVLHGELRDYGGTDDTFGIKDLERTPVDYYALGHYHSYSAKQLAGGGSAVYCGTPEGRGFDEVGECGFVLLDTSGIGISHKFIRFAKRMQIICPVDISKAKTNAHVESLITSALSSYGRENLIRIQLCGERDPALKLNTDVIKSRFKGHFFYFEIKDKTKLKIDMNALRFDKSLKGEFLRLCLNDVSLSDEERQMIIDCGLAALSGESYEVTE